MSTSQRRLRPRALLAGVVAAGATAALGFQATAASPPSTSGAARTAQAQSVSAQHEDHPDDRLAAQGKQTFRFDTFGDEAFWGDLLNLDAAIAGKKNGGVGPGVSPKTALAVGLMVDVNALPPALRQQI